MKSAKLNAVAGPSKMFSTFFVADRLYGIEVTAVQEVTSPKALTNVPLAPEFVRGLINLRGQISIALDLGRLFEMPTTESMERMSVVCQSNQCLVSLLVDQIGDVIEVESAWFENIPEVIAATERRYLSGVYKLPDGLLAVVDVAVIFELVDNFAV